MNKKIATILLVTLAVVFNYGISSAQNSAIIGLLKSTPNKTIRNCTGEDLMALLSDDGETWIQSIECANIDLISGKAGAIFALKSDATESSFIKFNFKSSPLLKATNVTFYGNDPEGKEISPLIFVNTDRDPLQITSTNKFFRHSMDADNASVSQIDDAILGKAGSFSSIPNARIYTNALGDDNLIKFCKIEYTPIDANDNIQLFALRVFYSETVNNPSTSIEETLNDDQTPAKYYDLQGRELRNIPERGLYLRLTNGKTTKHIAR